MALRGLVGRADLMERIRDTLAAGGGVVLRGSAGVGKSHLMAAALAEQVAAGLRTATIVGSEAVQTMPFGAFLPLLTRGSASDDSAEGIEAVGRRLRVQLAPISPGVLGVDDAHLLDAASIGLLYEQTRSGLRSISTVPAELPVPESLVALWRESGIRILDVPDFDGAEAHAFAAMRLAGAVDRRLSRALAERSGGNPRLLAHLIVAGRRTGAFSPTDGIWLLVKPLPPVPEVLSLLALDLETLSPTMRRLMELAVIGDPLPLEVARALVEPADLEEAEERGLVSIDKAGAGQVRPGHPMWRDAIVENLPNLRRRRLLNDLATTWSQLNPGDGIARVRIAKWRLERADVLSVSELTELYDLVRVAAPGLREMFARAAVAAEAGVDAELRLADLLAQQHRTDEALAQLDAIDQNRATADQQARSHLIRAYLRAIPAHRPADALALLDRVFSTGDPPAVGVVRAAALLRSGRVREAEAVSRSLLEDPTVAHEVAFEAGLVAGYACVYAGDRVDYRAVRSRLGVLAPAVGEDAPSGPDSLRLLDAASALMLGENVPAARTFSADGYLAALERGDDAQRAEFAAEAGWLHVLGGDLAAAIPLLREAHAARSAWAVTTLPWVRSLLISGLVLNGDQAGAEEVGVLLAADDRAAIYDADVAIAQAALLAGRGALQDAALVSRRAAEIAEARGQNYLARVNWYAGMRYGDSACAAGVLRTLGRAETESDRAVAAHARSVGALDGAGAESAATLLANAGLTWFAIEAQAQAAAIHRRQRAVDRAAVAGTRLPYFLAKASGLDSPVVRVLHRPALTVRENELARLAAQGIRDRDIAAKFGISVRTVHTHLSRVYGKLGVSGRSELADRLQLDVV